MTTLPKKKPKIKYEQRTNKQNYNLTLNKEETPNNQSKSTQKSCRCTRAGLKQITCPSGLAFDIEKQTCDWKVKVTNCDKKESKWK